MEFKQGINVRLIVVLGVISGILLITIVFGVQAWFLSEVQDEVAIKADESPAPALVDAAEVRQHLQAEPHWTDKSRKVLEIPVAPIAGHPEIPSGMALIIANGGKLPPVQPAQ